MPAGEYRAFVAGLQAELDRLSVVQARALQHGQDHGLYAGTGARSMADWLAHELGTAHGDTVGRIRLATALENSDTLAAAVAAGEVSPSAVGAIAGSINQPPPGVSAADLDVLVEVVKGADPKAARAAHERWKQIYSEASETPQQREQRLYAQRSVRFAEPADGMISGTFSLPTLDGRQVMAALSHLAGKPCAEDGRTTEQRLADGLLQLCDAYAKGAVAGGRERPSLLLTASVETLVGLSDAPGNTLFGDLVPAHVLRRLVSTAEVQTAVSDGGEVVALSTTHRLATDGQWRALVARDGGCRWAGCEMPAHFCDVDHLTPWELGGPTELPNLILLCRHHHMVKHAPGTVIVGDAIDLCVQLANGRRVECPPRPLDSGPLGSRSPGLPRPPQLPAAPPPRRPRVTPAPSRSPGATPPQKAARRVTATGRVSVLSPGSATRPN